MPYSNNSFISKSVVIILVILCSSYASLSQRKYNVHIDLGVTQNHQGFLKLFDGVIDAGAVYNLNLTGNLFAGAGLTLSYYQRKGTTARSIFYKPALNLHYYFRIAKRLNLVPAARIGYSFMKLSNKEYSYGETQSGILTGTTIRMLWSTKSRLDYFMFGRFDYIFLDENNKFTKLNYYRNVYLTSFGVGVRIKSKMNEK